MSSEGPHEAPIGDAEEQDPPILSGRGDELTIGREREAPTGDDGPELWRRPSRRSEPSEIPRRHGEHHDEHQVSREAPISHILRLLSASPDEPPSLKSVMRAVNLKLSSGGVDAHRL
jgi:hypothetical protein